MLTLELLAPARNLEIGIAAIDSGADAVYIAGPFFGARKDAGNSVDDIAALCAYAHRFGARIFVTVNIELREGEAEELHSQMLAEQAAGVDAFIVRDERIFGWEDITVPLHASTQCAIRTPQDARKFEALGASRLVLERELSLAEVGAIRKAVSCELEFFVHGALCVCYSGECRLSEHLTGRSADRGECIQACRSIYDLTDESGKVLVKNKALLSLRDFNLHDNLIDLAAAGICSFKIEGRLKSASYVRNITRYYSLALDALVASAPQDYRRASFGRVSGGFVPDPHKTFNRAYTRLYLDGKRGRWSSMDAPSHLGSFVGRVAQIRPRQAGVEIVLGSASAGRAGAFVAGGASKVGAGKVGASAAFGRAGFGGAGRGDTVPLLHNGDGFAFIDGASVVGFRGDVCEWPRIVCRSAGNLKVGADLYRNIDAAFEHEIEKNLPKREINVYLSVEIRGRWSIEIGVRSEDGREFVCPFKADVEVAENRERAESMLREQLSKRVGHYSFSVVSVQNGPLPLLSASTINAMRRLIAADLDSLPCGTVPMANARRCGRQVAASGKATKEPLMRSRYCVRYELGMCPIHQGAKNSGPLFLTNNGRRLSLHFDCKRCEMTVDSAN